MGRYVAARRIGREDLAEALRVEAVRQHEGCPLYRLACRGLLADEGYPDVKTTVTLIHPLPSHVSVGWN
jgi:hypothetical protein